MERERPNYQPKPTVVAYEPQFDRLAYQVKEEEDKKDLDAYTKRNLETHLGERFNVLLSTTRFDVRSGQVFPQNADEPFIQTLARGRDYRRLHGNAVDFAREEAEVLGFAKIEATLLSESAGVGDIDLSISQPGNKGTIYKHNFYDIFTLKQDEKGKFIEGRRYSSGLTIEETTKKLKDIGLIDPNSNPTAEKFLANPIRIDPKMSLLKSADDIHKYLHKDHAYTSKEDFEEASRMIASLIVGYVNSLSENPFDQNDHNLRLNAALNGMDLAIDLVQKNKNAAIFATPQFTEMFKDKNYVYALGAKPVRQVDTGCGSSGGFRVNGTKEMMKSPFSLADKDLQKSSDKQTLCCTCPFCEKQVEAEIGGGTITCPNCKKSASWSN